MTDPLFGKDIFVETAFARQKEMERARRDFAAVKDPAARALFSRRVGFLDGNAYTSRPGPRLVDAAEILARLIHGSNR